MDKLKIQIIYNGKQYEFEEGLKAYVFYLGVQNGVDMQHGMDALIEYVNLVANCIYADTNETVIADFAYFVADRWMLVVDMDRGELLEYYYDNKIY